MNANVFTCEDVYYAWDYCKLRVLDAKKNPRKKNIEER